MEDIARQLLSAQSVKNVIDCLNRLREEHSPSWLPVGGIDNNLATIGLGSDPAAGLIERVTNALDAVIDKEWQARNRPPNVLSPRVAAEEWLGIPKGRLSEIKGAQELRAYSELARKVIVTLQDSEKNDEPSVEIRDQGIGLRSDDFSESILGLNKNRKLRKLFLAGAFGQGGSTALAYSRYTIIASRAQATAGKTNPVAITVVVFDPGDPDVDKHGHYKYLINPTTQCPYEFDLPVGDFEDGTLVRHVAMELNKYKAIMTAPTGSLWYLAHNYLFDPVLPFTIRDARKKVTDKKNGKPETRTVTGNNRRLAQWKNTEHKNRAERTFRDGKVVISWWVIKVEGENPRDKITNFTLPSKPIIVTFNGQKQGDFPNTIIKNDLKLPYLDRYIIVQVDCDRLDSDSRRQLFPTTRESIRDTPIGDDLRRLVTETLSGDDELRRLDRERMKRLITRVDSSSVEVIRKRLANRVKLYTQASGGGSAPSKFSGPDDKPRVDKREPIPIQDPPTFLSITNPAPRNVYAGKSFTLKFETDASPDYFEHPDSFIAVCMPHSFSQYTGTTRINKGYGTAYFKAASDLQTEDTGSITLELRPPESTSLHDSIDAVVIDLPDSAGTGKGNLDTPSIDPLFIYPSDPFWKDRGWSENSVAEVDSNDEAVVVSVSGANKHLDKLLARAQRQSSEAVESLKDFYLEHISFHAVIAQMDSEKAEGAGEDPSVVEENLAREYQHACETVCGVISSMFDVLVVTEQTNSQGGTKEDVST